MHSRGTIRIGLILLALWLPGDAMAAPDPVVDLTSDAARGFDRYIQLTEQRMRQELPANGTFLWVERLPEEQRRKAYERLQGGEIVSERLETRDPSGEIHTPGAMIHHWVGTVFIPGVSLAQVLAIVQDYNRHSEYYQPQVVQSRLVQRQGDEYEVHYRLRQKHIITITLDTDYDVHHYSLDATHAASNSRSTRIAQVEDVGEHDEHDLPPGHDGGFLWRLNSYWRYFDAGRGVYVQCEAVSLTRDIPTGLGWLIRPFVESVPKESLEFTLQSTRSAVLRASSHRTR